MLESFIELLAGLFLIALTLLICSCIVGSIVAAIRAVNHGSATMNISVLGRMQKRGNTVAQHLWNHSSATLSPTRKKVHI
jgi:hypothetical protein